MASSSKSSTEASPDHFAEARKPITSFGPAGTKLDVREAGENIVNTFCHQYPDTNLHSIVPNFFIGNITELMDPRPDLSSKEEEQLRGRSINQVGEGHENVVFNLFVHLTRQKDMSPTLLVMRMFEMDTKNAIGLKKYALMSQLPNLNLKATNTSAENDFAVLVKDYEAVFVEVKGSTKDSMMRSAEKQLTNVNSIVQCVMKAITGSRKRIIPTIKLVIIPECTDPSPTEKTPQGSYLLFKDACDDFENRWMEIVNELGQLRSSNPFTADEFKELSHILVGIWSAKAISLVNQGVKVHCLKQDRADFSYVDQLKKIDITVDTSNVRDETQFKLREDKMNPLTDIVRTDDLDIFRSCNDIKLCYLTPTQKHIFSFEKRAIVRSSAGCGKSLLNLFKTLELVSNNSTESSCKILILAPTPHNVRIYNCLEANNIAVEMIDQFPPTESTKQVFVMDINKFFKVERSTLMGYDLTNYHLLMDDVQHMDFRESCTQNFYDVGDVIFG